MSRSSSRPTSGRKCIARSATTFASTGGIQPKSNRETSEYMLYAGLFAAASGQEFFAWRGGVGTSIPELNPDLVEFMDPIGKTKKIIAVPPLRPDWAIVHVGWSDVYGNGQHLGARFCYCWLCWGREPHHDPNRAHRAEFRGSQRFRS